MRNCLIFAPASHMVVVAQLVRASVCGAEGRGFESHHPPKKLSRLEKAFFILKY